MNDFRIYTVIMNKKILVRIIAGSKTDMQYVEQTQQVLDDFDVPYDMHISSAHRNPERTEKLAKEAEENGVQVITALHLMVLIHFTRSCKCQQVFRLQE